MNVSFDSFVKSELLEHIVMKSRKWHELNPVRISRSAEADCFTNFWRVRNLDLVRADFRNFLTQDALLITRTILGKDVTVARFLIRSF